MPAHTKSNRRHALEGTLRRDRHGPVPAGARLRKVPPVPRELTEHARPHWRRLARVLVEIGTIRAADLPALMLLAETLASIDIARATIEREGMTVVSRGATKAHPALTMLDKARAQAVSLLDRFGLNPVARQKVETVGTFAGGRHKSSERFFDWEEQDDVASKYFRAEQHFRDEPEEKLDWEIDDPAALDGYLATRERRRQ
jgi:P27 family predicted phage terminase small subunit